MARKTKKKWPSYLGISFLLAMVLGLAWALHWDQEVPKSSVPEARLVVYSPNSNGLLATVVPAFEQAYGVRVQLVQDSTGNLFDRLKSGDSKSDVDLVFGGSTLWYEANQDYFIPYAAKGAENLPASYRAKDQTYTPYAMEGTVILANRQLTQGLTIHSYDDLLNPSLQGKIGLADPRLSSSGFSQLLTILLAKGGYQSEAAWDFVGQLYFDQEAQIYKESSEVNRGLVQGQVAVGLSTEAVAQQLIAEGAALDLIYPDEGSLYLPAGVGIAKGTKHLDLAQAFVDYLLSDTVQASLAETLYQRPILTDQEQKSDLRDWQTIKRLSDESWDILDQQDQLRQRFEKEGVKASGRNRPLEAKARED
ncbi:extracellular solute-binding protein [Aerococcus sp. UMB8608]|uniref:Extracellular solute-binding protein n=1 Tax=Aerococcus sanguinicola TaxID=119206 RepID=A0A5N1GPL6_9LACT|nr:MULTISPECIES: extracellular solute-binding protein [Aerococcus]KAA9302199.1 extracellular solute-binding protein [Aerococcus sanguinicola]MDK6368371.1 extracellular solute-binding protein [Aerococcus sp. UMB9870]MDK6679453.1 extracellular solute-binding protein [Aerococcus sp. UMB8608]MDK6687220.1 extracellular solute-binding protein [Aerococcus sp. UMB8623]MDK6941082.1 extracellular solute-binding protein [Aerococcus sp. UMB8487]